MLLYSKDIRVKLTLGWKFLQMMRLQMNQSAATLCTLLLRYLKTISEFDFKLTLYRTCCFEIVLYFSNQSFLFTQF
jgi:hypothetical protein